MTVETENIFVALGSNLGNSARTLLRAWNFLGEQEGITLAALSPPFLTAPVDMTSHHWFTNAVGSLSTSHTPDALLDILFEVESALGRTRTGNVDSYQDRIIDLDLLYFGAAILDSPRLTLPHPRRTERLFVLAPMAVIAPGFVDPEHLRTIDEIHSQLREKILNNHVSNQEITASSWPEEL